MRIALVHDWLTGLRGGERVLDELAGLFPEADLHTLIHVPGSTTARIEQRRIHASPLSRLPGVAGYYRGLLALFPWAVGRLYVDGVDALLSTSHAVAKAVPHAPEVPHLCYCHTPMRYVWDHADTYHGRGARRQMLHPLIQYLRRFDIATAGPGQVTRFVANSQTVAERIRRRWGREARVIYPPVDTERIRPSGKPPDDYYLLVGGFVPYKREDLVLEAFRAPGRRLVVAGDGPRRAALAAGAPAHVEFVGRVPDAALAELYRNCRALLYPQEEDFGLIAVEAQAAGRPVIAYGRGGASETVVPGVTGVWFEAQTPEAVRDAVVRFEACEADFDPEKIRAHAEGFSAPRFRREIEAELRDLLDATARLTPAGAAGTVRARGGRA